MLLERLFQNLALRIEPFGVCEVAADWRLHLDALASVTFHFVLRGEGHLHVQGHPGMPLASHSLAIVPPERPHALAGPDATDAVSRREPGGRVSARTASRTASGLVRMAAGPAGGDELVVACGRVRVVYGEGLGLFDLLSAPLVLDFAGTPEMAGIFRRLLAETINPSPTSAVMMTSLMNECLVLVFRALCDRPDCPLPWLTALDDRGLAAALTAILERPADPHTVASLAERALMSRSAFARDFARRFGRPPMTYVREVRLRRAAELLRTTDLQIDAIASRVGIASRSYFTKAFQAHFGLTPGEFRRDPAAASIDIIPQVDPAA